MTTQPRTPCGLASTKSSHDRIGATAQHGARRPDVAASAHHDQVAGHTVRCISDGPPHIAEDDDLLCGYGLHAESPQRESPRPCRLSGLVRSRDPSSSRAEVWLLRVLPGHNVADDDLSSGCAYLDRLARQLAHAGLNVGTQVRTGPTADAVMAARELLSADLLLVAA
ncbi:MAG: hypothetical protein M3336_04270 [Chloroflexota bacterium]|nr:hypothetical protein [Chloroflexota bacterium]